MVSKKDKLKALKALLGEEAEAILAAADESEKELDEAGVAFKEAEDPEDQEDLEDYEDDEEEDLEEEEKAAKPGKKPMPMAEDEEDMEEEYMEDETPVIGNMPVEEYKSMLKEAFGAALEPVTKALMSNRKKQAEAGETVEALEQRLAELQKNEESMTKEIKRLTRQLKELSGETPRAARGYRASEDEDTIVDETEQKELGAPTQDPFAVSFVNDLLGINPSRQ